jgi:thiamine-phosphate pyrophosphorylase
MSHSLRPSLDGRSLYLVCDAAFTGVAEALRGGVGIVQLRDRRLPDGELLAHARMLAELVHAHGGLFLVNDRVDVALLAGADGVHVGQEDISPRDVRELCGDRLLIGLSTHNEQQIAAAADVDYIGVGPVVATPTKPGRPSVGLELVRHAAARVSRPWFAIGGIDAETAPAVVAAGATRLAVVRAITDAPDPRSAAEALSAATGPRPRSASVRRTSR